MQALKELTSHMRERPIQLRQMKEEGTKIVGYFVGDYVPEEMIYASGAVPLCLCHGGDPMPADVALSATTRFLCPFSRAQYGEKLLGEHAYYEMVDMLVDPITCQHLRRAGDLWDYYTDVAVFRLGIPHEYNGEDALNYYVDASRRLKTSLEELTGKPITDEALREAIDLYNRMRTLLKDISLTKQKTNPPISELEFIKLNHASMYADPVLMVEALESIYQEIKDKDGEAAAPDAPRLLLVSPNIAYGDYKILELVNEAEGMIVAEEICEGVRFYWENVKGDGDLVEAIARRYLKERLPCAFMRDSTMPRLDFVSGLVKKFNAVGVIWYQLLYCDTYDIESFFFTKEMQRMGIPVLKLESDYDILDRGTLRTRIETFIETIKVR
ncbi:2-hydroxyacyl-CoA dehydratase subunit D [Chloroflexota bacterium]